MIDAVLYQLRVIMQRDVNNRGLATLPENNLISACKDDFAAACRQLHRSNPLRVGLVTGFWIQSALAPETDGPLGVLFLARVLHALGSQVRLIAEDWCQPALLAGLRETGLADRIQFGDSTEGLTHLIAIERAGPSHTLDSFLSQKRASPPPMSAFAAVPAEHYDQYHNMRGQIITEQMLPLHRLFESAGRELVTIGIGDGGNEIGMGKIPWEVIATNIPSGALVACRIATQYNLVCGVSNWGAYALAVGLWHWHQQSVDRQLFNIEQERRIGERILREARLVDGMTGQRTLSVDGLPWEVYSQPIAEMFSLLSD